MSDKFPFPTQIEVIRAVCHACGLPTSQLKDIAYDRSLSPEKVVDALKLSLLNPLERLLGKRSVSALATGLDRALSDYVELVVRENADGLKRQQVLPILVLNWFLPQVHKVLQSLVDLIRGPHLVTLLQTHDEADSAIAIALNWLSKHEPDWNLYLGQCPREQRLKIETWRSGKHRPDVQSLSLLAQQGGYMAKIDWSRVKGVLLLARAIDYLSDINPSFLEEIRVLSMGASSSAHFGEQLRHLKDEDCGLYGFQTEFHLLMNRLDPARAKSSGEKSEVEAQMERMHSMWLSLSAAEVLVYQVSWLRARWCVATGELLEANQMYKLAINDCLYRGGSHLEALLHEALAIAANQPRPDRVFLKQLKNVLNTFFVERELKDGSSDIEDGDIQMWKNSLFTVFPLDGVFPEYREEMSSSELRPWISCDLSLKPDLSRPDKKIYTGADKKKRIHQLTWFSLIEDFESVEALIETGARVNVASPVGETPLLMALEALNVSSIPYRSLDKRLFDLIAQQPGADKQINKATHKKKLLPIISAVESGRLEVVAKVLELGGDPNGRGLSDGQTPLNICLKRIGQLIDPEAYREKLLELMMSPYVLDSLRRETQGIGGATLAQQQQTFERLSSDPLYQEIVMRALDLQSERIQKHLSLGEMRSIAKLLLDKGADPNAIHRSPVDGYTPLMLASELNEQGLFEVMLCKEGNPKQTFFCPRTRLKADCWSIASYWKSTDVIQVLNWIAPHLPTEL